MILILEGRGVSMRLTPRAQVWTNLTRAVWVLLPKTTVDDSSLLIFESFGSAHAIAVDPARPIS